MSALRVKALQNHYKQVYQDKGHPNFWMVVDPGDIGTWYVLIHDLGEEHEGGEYLMRMTAPENYPYGPPKFELFTPNPRYQIGKSRPCVSMGEYHSNNYPAILGMYGFTCELIYTFHASDTEMGGGISMKTGVTKEEKLILARESVAYNNKHYAVVMELFKEERTRVFKNPLKKVEMPVEIDKPKKVDKSDKTDKSSKSKKSSKTSKIQELESQESSNETESDPGESQEPSNEFEPSEEIVKIKKSEKSSKSSKTSKTSESKIVTKSTKKPTKK